MYGGALLLSQVTHTWTFQSKVASTALPSGTATVKWWEKDPLGDAQELNSGMSLPFTPT